MTIRGLDGMRYLGSDPRVPADDVERIVMHLVDDVIVREQQKAAES
jgi:hypothetical protein